MRDQTSDFSIGAASLHINKRSKILGLLLKRVFIAFNVFIHSNNLHISKVR